MNEGMKQVAVRAIWRGESLMSITDLLVKQFDLIPGGSQEGEVAVAVAKLHTDIQVLITNLPSICEAALRKGYSRQQVIEVIDRESGHLIPGWNLDVVVSGAQAKIAKESEFAREAIEKDEYEKKRAAIQAQIDGALANLRRMGVEL